MKRRILVTGASGFIGRALVSILSPDYEIWALTLPGEVAGLPIEKTIELDLSMPDVVQSLQASLPVKAFDAVLHLAARTPRLGDKNLGSLLSANALGTWYLLEGLPCPPLRLAYFSTIDVYGQSGSDVEFSEQSPVSPDSTYALSKLAGERATMIWSREHDVPCGIFRLAQVYGPNDQTAKAIPSFCRAVTAGRRPVIRGTGLEIRQPIHVHDVCLAVRSWLGQPISDETQIFVLAGRERVTIRDLANLTMQLAGMSGDPEFVPSPASRLVHYCIDLNQTEAALNWKAEISLREGIAEILQGIREQSL